MTVRTYSLAEMAEVLGISEARARKMLSDRGGDLPRVPHTGSRVLCPRWAVDELIARPVRITAQAGESFS